MSGEDITGELTTVSGEKTNGVQDADLLRRLEEYDPGSDPTEGLRKRKRRKLEKAAQGLFMPQDEPNASKKLGTVLTSVAQAYQGVKESLKWSHLKEIAEADGRDLAAQCQALKKDRKEHPEKINDEIFEAKMNEFDLRIMQITAVYLTLQEKVEKGKKPNEQYEMAALNEYVAMHKTRFELQSYYATDPDELTKIERNFEMFSAFQEKLEELPTEDQGELAKLAKEQFKLMTTKIRRSISNVNNRGQKPEREREPDKKTKRIFNKGGRALRPATSLSSI